MIKFIEREYRGTCIFITHNEGFERICNQHIHVENHMFKEIPLQKIDVPIVLTSKAADSAQTKTKRRNYVK
jgi:ATPase subunit of ABC transporter with duplicated ATPase domains